MLTAAAATSKVIQNNNVAARPVAGASGAQLPPTKPGRGLGLPIAAPLQETHAQSLDTRSRDQLLAIYRYMFICDTLSAEVVPLEVQAANLGAVDVFQPRSAFSLRGASFPLFQRVRVGGTIVERQESETILQITLDDMTGVVDIRVPKRSAHPKRLAQMTNGSLVEFLGELKHENGRRWIDASIFNVKVDPLFTILFPLRTIQMYQTHYFPDSFPEIARQYSQRMTQLASQGPSQMQPEPEEEQEFLSALDDLAWVNDLSVSALQELEQQPQQQQQVAAAPVPQPGPAPANQGDIEFDDDLDYSNLMNVDFDAAAAAAAANNSKPSLPPQQQPQPQQPEPKINATPSFDDFDLDGNNDDLDALFNNTDIVMQDPLLANSRISDLAGLITKFIMEASGARKRMELEGYFGALGYSGQEVARAVDNLTQGFVVYQDGDMYRLM